MRFVILKMGLRQGSSMKVDTRIIFSLTTSLAKIELR
jgi:hypothetical protein